MAMALLKSIQKAQSLLACELCEIETKIEWKCTDCNLLMCEICKNKVHPKFKKAKYHKIITIQKVGLHKDDSGQRMDFSDIQCKDHSGQVCCLFCKSCDHLVCPTGVIKNHKQHELLQIEKAFIMKKEVLKIKKEKLEKQHENWITNFEKIKAIKEKDKLDIATTTKNIQKQKHVWKEAGDLYAEDLCSEVNKQWRLKESATEIENWTVKHFEKHLTNKIRLIEDISISKNASKFFEDIKSFDDLKEMPIINLNFSELPTFVPIRILQSFFGSIQDKIHKHQKIEIKAIREYTTELARVTQIIQCAENTFWIHDMFDEKIIQKVTSISNSYLKVLSQVRKNALRTTLTKNGDLLISDLTSNIQILKENGKMTTSKYNFKPYFLKPIHISRENQLIVGAVKKLPIDYSVPGGDVLLVLDLKGNSQAKYEFDNNNKPLSTSPIHITTTKNGNIFVIDQISHDNKGRVVILQKGTVRNIYIGHLEIIHLNHRI